MEKIILNEKEVMNLEMMLEYLVSSYNSTVNSSEDENLIFNHSKYMLKKLKEKSDSKILNAEDSNFFSCIVEWVLITFDKNMSQSSDLYENIIFWKKLQRKLTMKRVVQ